MSVATKLWLTSCRSRRCAGRRAAGARAILRLGVDVDRLALHGVEAPEFVDAEGVVDVVVGEDHGVAAREPAARACWRRSGPASMRMVRADASGVGETQARRGPQAAVAGRRRCRRARAGNRGHAGAGAGAQERQTGMGERVERGEPRSGRRLQGGGLGGSGTTQRRGAAINWRRSRFTTTQTTVKVHIP